MTAPYITVLWNSSSNDTANTGAGEGDSNFKVFDTINDKFSFLGSEAEDQDPNSTKSIFVIPESGSKEIPRQFVNDYSTGKWDRVFLGGSNADDGEGGNNRYVYGAYIDGTTASAPILQAWDSTDHSTYNLEVLGSGTPANSMLKAITTTNGSPGDSWAGTPIAGDSPSYSIALDTGAINSSKMVYWNMRVVVPSTANVFKTNPVLCIYLTYV